MATTSPTIPQLFTDLERAGKDGQFAKAQKIASKILEEIPDDPQAMHCKIVCLIQQSQFPPAIDVINSAKRKGLEYPFEKAYCLYRLNKPKEALDLLESLPEPGLKEKELLAQVLYRLEEYEQCQEVYTDLIRNSSDDCGDERETNLAAVIAAGSQWKNMKMDDPGLREDTFELCYNAACLALGNGNYQQAEKKLLLAEELCRKSLEDDPDITEEEIEAEMGVLRTQLGYAYQVQGKTELAMKLYNQVLKSKPSDIALAAVTSNNIVTINKDQHVFDSKKKINTMSSDALVHKLTKMQLQIMSFNKCLFLLCTNQIEACSKMIESLKKTLPDSDFPHLIQAALFSKDKKPKKAIEHLESYAENQKQNVSQSVQLSLVQLHLSQGNIKEACEALRSVKEIQHKPGVVSALVTLYSQLGNINAAVEVLDSAVQHSLANKGSVKQAELIVLMRENAKFKLQHGMGKEAVHMLEKLHSEDPGDVRTLAQLISAYSQFDPRKAEQYSERLPPIDLTEATLDVNALEMSHGALGRYGRKPKQEEIEIKRDAPVKMKVRKKKKGKLPKNYNHDVDPDPERWLPARERTYYKGRRKKKDQGVGKGTQGAASPSAKQVESPKPTPSSPKAASSPPGTPGGPSTSNIVPPRQQQPQAAKKKQRGKKKKGGGGW